MNAAIATKLNGLESAIVRVEEWAHVLFVLLGGSLGLLCPDCYDEIEADL